MTGEQISFLPLLHSEYDPPTCLSEFAKDKESLTRNSPHSHPSLSPTVGVGNVEKVCCCKLGTCSTLGTLVVWSRPHCLEKMATQGQSVCVSFLHYVMKLSPKKKSISLLFLSSSSFRASLWSSTGHIPKLRKPEKL